MRHTGLAAIVLIAVSAGAAHAELFDAPDWAQEWYRRVEALAQSLTGGRLPDHEIIRPAENIDPQMALMPPQRHGRARIIIPPGETGR